MKNIRQTQTSGLLFLPLLAILAGCSQVVPEQIEGVQTLTLPQDPTEISTVDFGCVRLALPWEAANWKHFFEHGFRFQVPELSGVTICVNAYAGREPGSEGFYEMLTGVLHGGSACPLGKRQRSRLRKLYFGDGVVFEFGDAEKRGFIYEKPAGTFIVMVFSISTPDALQLRLRGEGEGDFPLDLGRASLLASGVHFVSDAEALAPDEFCTRISQLNGTKVARDKREERIEHQDALDGSAPRRLK